MTDALSPLTTVLAATSAKTDQMMQIAMIQQQHAAEQSVVSLLQQAVDSGPAPLPDGQGRQVDVSV